MRATWHYMKNGKENGPLAFEDLQRLATTGELKETDEVWRQGSAADWTAARNVPGLFDGSVSIPPLVAESVGTLSTPGDTGNDAGEGKPSPGQVLTDPKKSETYFYRLHRDGSVKETALSISFEELKQYVDFGTLKPTDELRVEGNHEWIQASTLLPDLFSNTKPAAIAPTFPVATPDWPSVLHDSASTNTAVTCAIPEQPQATPEEPVRFASAESVPQVGIVPEPSRIERDTRLMAGPKGKVEPICDLASPEPKRVQESEPSNLKPCPDCGHMVSFRAKSCPKCGAPQDTQSLCSDCGKSFSIKARTCPHCGAPNEASPSLSSQPTASGVSGSHRGYDVALATHETSGGSWEAVAFACWIAGFGLVITVISAFLLVFQWAWVIVTLLLSTIVMLLGRDGLSLRLFDAEARCHTCRSQVGGPGIGIQSRWRHARFCNTRRIPHRDLCVAHPVI